MSDLISRQAAIDAMETWDKFGCDPDGKLVRYDDDKHYIPYVHYEDMVHAIKHLPSAQPERKTGHWIKTARWGRVYYCDQCRNYLDFDGVNAGRGSANFCPNCGAKMNEEGKDD